MELIDIRRRLLSAPVTWIEITKTEHAHGGAGWEFGTCLWSPSRNRVGADVYSLMRRAAPDDAVIHFLENHWPDGPHETRIVGTSTIASKFDERSDQPPEPGDWAGMAPYYRVPLRDYVPFTAPVPVQLIRTTYADEFRAELVEDQPRYYPFIIYRDEIRTGQGAYLTRATPRLIGLLLDALGLEAGLPNLNPSASAQEAHLEYAEGQRRRREAVFFARSPRLVADAKAHHGLKCQVCGFDFENEYGELGSGYIECHHLNPLSERAEGECPHWSLKFPKMARRPTSKKPSRGRCCCSS